MRNTTTTLVMPKRPGKVTEQALPAQLGLEHAVFGDTHTGEDGQLSEPEIWWSQQYNWLKDNGYLLRPRYTPGWIPSWHGTKKSWIFCEDGRMAPVSTAVEHCLCLAHLEIV
jgi:hypothetical protein